MDAKLVFNRFISSISIVLLPLLLTHCASSSVSRSAASEADSVYESSNNMVSHAGDSTPNDAFQNATQTTKGAIIGGAAGAVAGGISSGSVGLLPGAAGGAVIGGILGSYIDYHTSIRDQLENRAVKILTLGDQILLVLPSAQIFNGMTPNLRAPAYSTLDLVAAYINQFTSMNVRVGAYTNHTGAEEVNCVVSQQQATTIVKYLWPRLHTRVLSGYGYGGTNLIERNNLEWAAGANYRIEITLERLPV